MVTLTTNEISITFFALSLLLLSAFACGKLFERIKAPKVVGEIVGGMILGGSLLGLFFSRVHTVRIHCISRRGQSVKYFLSTWFDIFNVFIWI